MRPSNPTVLVALLVTAALVALAAASGPPRPAAGGQARPAAVTVELPEGSGAAAYLPPRPPEHLEEQRQAAAAYTGATLALAAMVVGLCGLFALQARFLRQLGAARRFASRTRWPQPEARPLAPRPAARVLRFRVPRPAPPVVAPEVDGDEERVDRVLDRLLRAVG